MLVFLRVPHPTRTGLLRDQNITGHHSAFGFLQVFITNGWLSDLVIVVAITNREARSPAHGISLFLVENGMKGFIKGRKLHKMGMKAQVGDGVDQIWQFIVHSQSESRYGASFRHLPVLIARVPSQKQQRRFLGCPCLSCAQQWEGVREF